MEIHNCIHCGTETQPNWRFCRRCGTALENLDQQPTIAHCSNCSSPVGDGWRFCFNCGTGTDDATALGGSGLSSDDVADLIATPPTDAMTTAAAVAEAAAPEPIAPEPATPEPEPAEPEPATPEPIAPEPIAPAPAQPERAPEVAEIVTEASEPGEPVITGMDVSFEANPDLAEQPVAEASASLPPSPSDLAPPRTEVTTEPPAPPLADSLEAARRAAAEHGSVEPPPAPPAMDAPPEEPISQSAAPVAEPPAEDAVAARVEEEPTIHLPERDTDRTVRADIPKPIGAARNPVDTQLPRPIGQDGPTTTDSESAATARVAVPKRRPRPEPRSAEGLPPIDGRTFQNPGVLGQMLQLALIFAAAISVAMMVGLILLNNRLDAYATSGEGLNRIESAESLINTWLRPLLALAVLGVYVFLVFWARRVTRNLSFFDRAVPETALWMWVIPLVNVFMLYRHLDLAWKGSDALRQSAGWRKGRPDFWNLGFAILVVAGFGLVIYGFVLGADTFEAAIDANSFSMIGYALLAVSLLCASKAVGDVIHRQRTRAENFA